MAKRFEGWQPQVAYGFVVYTHSDFQGCIRQNPHTGTAEVFMDKSPFFLSAGGGDPVYVEGGHGGDGQDELARAIMFVETMPTPEDPEDEEAEDGFRARLERVADYLSAQSGLEVRVEGGELVIPRHERSPFRLLVQAVTDELETGDEVMTTLLSIGTSMISIGSSQNVTLGAAPLVLLPFPKLSCF